MSISLKSISFISLIERFHYLEILFSPSLFSFSPANERWHGLIGGESIREFAARIHSGATEFLKSRGIERIEHELPLWSIEEPGRTIVLFAHAGTNSVTIGHLLGLDPNGLSYFFNGLDQKLVGVEGAQPIHQVIA